MFYNRKGIADPKGLYERWKMTIKSNSYKPMIVAEGIRMGCFFGNTTVPSSPVESWSPWTNEWWVYFPSRRRAN